MTAICIWTPTGWYCASSPLKRHYAAGKKCVVLPAARGVSRPIVNAVAKYLRKEHLRGVDPEVIAKVVGLMVAVKVDRKTPFTIIKVK